MINVTKEEYFEKLIPQITEMYTVYAYKEGVYSLRYVNAETDCIIAAKHTKENGSVTYQLRENP